ncbi:MAG: hypothetical protein AAFY99_01790 [Pseudomonadota bacterium]
MAVIETFCAEQNQEPIDLLARFKQRRAHRHMLDELLSQPDSVLEDAGYTRAQAETERSRLSGMMFFLP